MRKSLGLIGILGITYSIPAIAGENTMRVYCENKSVDIELADNPSAQAFAAKLADGDITVKLADYGDFEKTGDLGFALPRSDKNITTAPGDIILYMGDKICIYYDTNTWNFTHIGKIPNMTRESMLEFFGGAGDVSVTFSLK